MDQDLMNKFEEQEKKIDAIYASVEKTRKYFQWTLIVTVVTIVLPIVVIIILLPWLMNTLSSAYGGLL